MIALVLALLLQSPPTVVGAEADLGARLAHCRSLAKTSAKAACYDAVTDSLGLAPRGPVAAAQVAPAAASAAAASATAAAGPVPAPPAPEPPAARNPAAQFGFSAEHQARVAARKPDAPREITVQTKVIARAEQDGAGRWWFHFEDGSVWAQTDTAELGMTPKPGMQAAIRRASLGSYLMTLEGRGGIRVARKS